MGRAETQTSDFWKLFPRIPKLGKIKQERIDLQEKNMKTVDEIVAAAQKLKPSQFLRLQQKLDRIQERIWKVELARVTEKMKKANITDEDINRMVMKRRYENRR